jgi:hypothetical protein
VYKSAIFENLKSKKNDHLPPAACEDLGSMYEVLKHDPFKWIHCSLHYAEYDRPKNIEKVHVQCIEMGGRS